MAADFAMVEVASRAALRAWLIAHYSQAESVWLITPKRAAGDAYLPYDAIVEEALCFGWVDSRPRALDVQRSMRLLSPRKPGAPWSRANRARVERLRAAGLMHPAGLAKVEAAQADGSWAFLEDVQDGVAPQDLAQALDARPGARAHFEAFPPSSQRIILEWIKTAKRPQTRARRIQETAEKAQRNERANHFRARTRRR